MPIWEKRVFQAQTTLPSDSGVFQLKLPKLGALSDIQLVLEWTGGATESHGVSIFDAFDLIEIVANGNYPIFSMTPHELLMWNCYHYKTLPFIQRKEVASGVHKVILNIPFSLRPKDVMQFLPLQRFADLELRVSYSPTIAATAGFTTSTGKVTVHGHICPDIDPQQSTGFLRNRTVKTFTSAASGEEKVEITGNFPLLALGIYNYANQFLAHSIISKVEVDVNDGGRKLFSDNFENLRRNQVVEMNISLHEQGEHFAQNGDDIHYFGDDVLHIGVQIDPGTLTIGTTTIPHVIVQEQLPHNSQIDVFSDTAGGTHAAQAAYSTDKPIYSHVTYRSVPRGAIIPFGFDGYLQNTVRPSEFSKMHLLLTQAAANADVRISQLELANPINS